jgi:undecaprenyl-diphosphatase
MSDFVYINTASFFWLNHMANYLPAWLWSSLTITGHTSMVIALAALLLLPRNAKNGGLEVLSAFWVCAIMGGLLVTLFKEQLQIARPAAVLSPEAFYLIGHKLELVSTPSGHTVTAFAVATLLIQGLRLRGWKSVIVLSFATAVALSRIAVGAHWPLDVVLGSALGVLCAYLSLTVTKTSYFSTKVTEKLFYQRLLIISIGFVSLSLFYTDMGYPKALFWQYSVASLGVMMSCYAAILHLKLSKRS